MPFVAGVKVVEVAGAQVKVFGPTKIPITLNINGAQRTARSSRA